jgi:flagellar basal body-associated protein FliL
MVQPMRASSRPAVLLLALTAALLALPASAADDTAKKKQKAPEHKVTQSESYLMLEPIYTSIVADNKPAGMLMIGMGLDVPDAGMRDEVTRSLPVLRDAYVRNLLAFTVTAVRTDAQPDVGMIADRLQAVTDRALKKKGAKVLLAQIALRVTTK